MVLSNLRRDNRLKHKQSDFKTNSLPWQFSQTDNRLEAHIFTSKDNFFACSNIQLWITKSKSNKLNICLTISQFFAWLKTYFPTFIFAECTRGLWDDVSSRACFVWLLDFRNLKIVSFSTGNFASHHKQFLIYPQRLTICEFFLFVLSFKVSFVASTHKYLASLNNWAICPHLPLSLKYKFQGFDSSAVTLMIIA